MTSCVAHRAAGLHDRRDAGFGRLVDAVAEREERIRAQRPRPPCRGRPSRALCTARNAASTRDIWPAPIPIVAPSRASTMAFDFTLRHRAPREQQVRAAPRPSAARSVTTCHAAVVDDRRRALLHEHAAAHALEVERVAATSAPRPRARAGSSCGRGSRARPSRERRRDDALDEQARHRFRRLGVDRHGERDHRAERRHRVARERLAVGVERRRADGEPARRGVLDDRAARSRRRTARSPAARPRGRAGC